MKLTPLDIHHKEFHRAIRGYNEEEVDKFLDEVAEEFERLFKENIDLKEQLEKIKQDLDGYAGMEKTLQNTLLSAQKSAEEIVVHSKKESELVLRDAELKSKEIIQEAHDLKRKYESTLTHLKQAEEEFRGKFKSMLESYMRIADSTAVLAEIGSNITSLDDKIPDDFEKPLSIEQELPKIGVMKSSDEIAEPQLQVTNDYLGETFTPDDIESFPGLGEPLKNKDKFAKNDLDRVDGFDIDSLAF